MKTLSSTFTITIMLSMALLTGCYAQTTIVPSQTALPKATRTASATATLSPTHTATLTPTMEPTATATATPSASPTAKATTMTLPPIATSPAASNHDGAWLGTTAQGQPITLKISNNQIIEMVLEFNPAVCSANLFMIRESHPLTDNSFQVPYTFGASTLFIVSGSIDAAGQMTGLITAEPNGLCEATSLPWNASR